MNHSANTPLSGAELIRRYVRDLPLTPGVYRMLDAKGATLYIGKARQLKARVSHYTNLAALPGRLQRMVLSTFSMEFTHTASEAEALLLEATLIKKFQPRYNILLKDDKSYPYIIFSGDHAYPRLAKYRGAKMKSGEYFGPFVSAHAVDETIALLQKAFLLRSCSDSIFRHRTRPCLKYQIKRCSAPCVAKVSTEEYAVLLAQAAKFLRGEGRVIQDQLLAEMQEASANCHFEKAAQLRDRVRALTHVQHQQLKLSTALQDADVIALARSGRDVCVQVFCYRGGRNYGNQSFFPAHAAEAAEADIIEAFLAQFYQREAPPKLVLISHEPRDAAVLGQALNLRAGRNVELSVPSRGDRREAMTQALLNAEESLNRHLSIGMAQAKLLEGVATLFQLEALPERIEVYDNSHVQGAHAVGAMIVAGAEGFRKKDYRQFNIKNEALIPGDDYGMMKEVLSRRFKRLLKEEEEGISDPPDLVLIDGGIGQLNAAEQVFSDLGLNIPLAAISKGRDRNAGREWFHRTGFAPFQLEPNDPVLHYLQRLRDEAHRFAIGTHRNKRSKAIRVSELDSIPGIGPNRKKALLHHFGSSRAVSAASIDDLASVPGVNRELAQKIYGHFH